jgi:hypothetical protein
MLEGSRLHVAVDTPAHTGIGEPLTYLSESQLDAGTLVRVPLGRREVTGVVWDERGAPEAQPGIELNLVDGRYTPKNRPVQDLISFHDIGSAELGMDWAKDLAAMAATPVEDIQLHYMRCAEPRGQLAKLFPDGWKPEFAATLRVVLGENRRYVRQHALDEIAAMQLTNGECSAALREKSGLTLAQMREAAREAKFRQMLEMMTTQILDMFEAVRARQ